MGTDHGAGEAARAAAAAKRREKARNLRYKHAVAKDVNWNTMINTLYEIQEECQRVQWFVDSEDGNETLLAAMDNDEEEAFEFKMAFSSLSADVERALDAFGSGYHECGVDEDDFNDFFAAIHASVDGTGDMWGYDEYEQDYYELSGYEIELGMKTSANRIMRYKKEEIIDTAQRCFYLAMQYVGLRSRYEDLKAAMDILQGQNAGYLQQIRAIEEAYEEATKGEYSWQRDSRKFDAMLLELPDRVWLE